MPVDGREALASASACKHKPRHAETRHRPTASTVERCGRTRWLADAEADHGGAIRTRRARAYRRTTGAVAAKESTVTDREMAMAPGRARTMLERVARDTPLRRSLRSPRRVRRQD